MSKEEYHELQRFFDLALDLLCIADIEGNFIRVNKAWEDILGYSVEELETSKFLDFVHPEDLQATLEFLAKLGDQEQVLNFINRYRCKDGSYRYIEWRSQPHGKMIYAAARDITDRQKVQDTLKQSEARNRALVEAIPDMLFRYNCSGDYVDVQVKDINMLHPMSRSACESDDIVGRNVKDLLPADTADSIMETIAVAIESGETQVLEYSYKVEGQLQYYEARLVSSGKDEVVSIVRDISKAKKTEQELQFLSMHDPLTGLYNRNYFENELERLGSSREYPIAMISADLDGLKLVNDTLGHKEGDRFILACAAVLKGALRGSDVLARVGGDEFALILPRTDEETGNTIIERIRKQIENYNSKRQGLPLSISLGLAVSENAMQPLGEAYAAADRVMYKDKLGRSREARGAIVKALLASVYESDSALAGFSERMQEYCIKMGQKCGLDDNRMADLALLAQVYELGKVTVSEEILKKKGKLTEQEWETVRQHAEKGFRIAFASPDLAHIAELILRHHENWDGSGYPLGLAGEEIPLECRILAVANTYNVITGSRPYARTFRRKEALGELDRCSGKQFDPEVVEIFKKLA